MAFLGKCFLRRSNPRIWRKLMSIGIHPDPAGMNPRGGFETLLCTAVDGDTFFCYVIEDIGEGLYDCGKNEDLFYAMSALRDDSDRSQWFIYDNRAWNDENPMRFWIICNQENIEDDVGAEMCEDCEKATLRELIEHFNGNAEDPVY